MASTSKIEWTDATWNPIRRQVDGKFAGHFCVKVSDGCTNCYAERMQPRFGHPVRYAAQEQANVEIYLDGKELLAPLRWKKPKMIFVGSMTDIFGDWVSDEWLDKLYAVMALCPQHTFQVVTKRAERMARYLASSNLDFPIAERSDDVSSAAFDIRDLLSKGKNLLSHSDEECLINDKWPLTNVWHMVSIEDQKTANERIPHLLRTPSAIRGISAEPLLGPVDLTRIKTVDGGNSGEIDALRGELFIYGNCGQSSQTFNFNKIDWVIAGGESGPNARPMHPDGPRQLRDQCRATRGEEGSERPTEKHKGTAFFLKQWGEWGEWKNHRLEATPGKIWGDGKFSVLVGKKAAGRLLDGVEHNEYPEQKT